MVVRGMNELPQLIDVRDGMDERALPAREQADDQSETSQAPKHSPDSTTRLGNGYRGLLEMFEEAGGEAIEVGRGKLVDARGAFAAAAGREPAA
jgi:hypothetical protein